MDSHKNKICSIRHVLPGRVRFTAPPVASLANWKSQLEVRIAGIPDVRNCEVTPLSRSILVYYDNSLLKQDALTEAIRTIITEFIIKSCQTELDNKNKPANQARELHEASISGILRQIGITAFLLIFAGAKHLLSNNMRPGRRFLTLPFLGSLYLAAPLMKSSLSSIKEKGKPNADTLESIAIIASLLSGREISSLTILLLHNIAELMTVYAMKRTKNAISELLSIKEEKAWKLLGDGRIEKVEIRDIKIKDKLVFHSGEKICVDGTISSGHASIDQSAITGEYLPAERKTGDKVFAGTLVKSGNITVKTMAVGDKTSVARIIHMVENAPNRKAQIQIYADRLSEVLVPANLLLFAGVLFITRDIVKALNMLVIDYSCGIRLSTATALTAAINTAAKNKVLIKGCNLIELISESDTLILDKTGTLTKGDPEVSSIVPQNSKIAKPDLIELAASIEETSLHPMAIALQNKLRASNGRLRMHGPINVTAGRGVEAQVGRTVIRVGNKKFMNENKIHTHPMREEAKKLSLAGENVIYVSRGRNIIGIIGIRDPLRDNMKKAINRLKINARIDDIILLTGDMEQQAEVISNRLGIDRYDYELMPEDKARIIMEIQSKGSKVVMVGDGINDAPALAYADVGIAMGSTVTDIAVETADITIAGDNPLMLPAVYSLSRKTMKIIKQNFTAAIGINTLGLLLGGTGMISVFMGALLHNTSTVLVVGNSLRLLFHDMNRRF